MKVRDKIFLTISAFRYCLGRQSNAVGWICEIIENEWEKMDESDKKLIVREIKEHEEMFGFSNTDKKSWYRILELV